MFRRNLEAPLSPTKIRLVWFALVLSCLAFWYGAVSVVAAFAGERDYTGCHQFLVARQYLIIIETCRLNGFPDIKKVRISNGIGELVAPKL